MRPAGNASGTVSRVSGQLSSAVLVMNPSGAIGGRSDGSRRMNKMNRPLTEYMTDQTRIPVFLPYPRFLLKTELTNTARVLYAMLLDRAKLSRRNGWKDEKGQIYLIYPISNMAKDLGKSQTTIKKAMRELEDAGLVEKKRQGFCMPNILYIKIPQEGRGICLSGRKEKEPSGKTETCRSEGKKSDRQRGRNVSSNQMNNSQKIQSQISGEREPRSVYGKYQNVYLSESEYRELQQEIPGVNRLIEELSGYMRSTGKYYADHAATLRRWAERSAPAGRIPDYICSEEESL